MDDLDALLTALAEQLGEKIGDLDGHERWRVLQRAVQRRVGFDLVFRAVGLERDQSMAGSVVTRVLEVLPDSEHAAWIDQLAPNHRRYCRNRADEIAIVRLARSGGYNVEDLAAHLDGWSDWVQRRLVSEVNDPHTLCRSRTPRPNPESPQRRSRTSAPRPPGDEPQRRPGPGRAVRSRLRRPPRGTNRALRCLDQVRTSIR